MKTRIALAVAAACFAGSSLAADFTDVAQVVSSTPILERVSEPRQDCGPSQTNRPAAQQDRSVIAPVIGGVAGALIGSRVGSGRGRDAATAAGAVAGTIVGDRVANPDSDRSMTGAVVGGAAGGLLGHQVGRGSGRTAATAAGAIGGAVVGDRVDNRQTAAAQPGQSCRTVETIREVVRGYSVVYRYNGREGTTTMAYDPGQTIRVGVTAIDSSRAAPAATSGGAVIGSNVREVRAADAAPMSAPSTPAGDYSYRY